MPVAKMEETERRFGCPLLELWGMTELGGLGTTHPHNGPRNASARSVCALPLDGGPRRRASTIARRNCRRGEVGELHVRGPIGHGRILR